MPTAHHIADDDRPKVTVDELAARLNAEHAAPDADAEPKRSRPTTSHEYFAALGLLVAGIAVVLIVFWVAMAVLEWALP